MLKGILIIIIGIPCFFCNVVDETQIYVPNKGVQKFKSDYGINKIEISY